jgi:hypothetical protein
VRTFNALDLLSPVFSTWSKKNKSRKAAVDAVLQNMLDSSSVEALLMSSRAFTEVAPKEVIEELGFSFSLWNKMASGVSTTVSVQCGSTVSGVGNCVNFSIERKSSGSEISPSTLLKVFRALIEIWEPEEGAILRDCSKDCPMALHENPGRLQFAHFRGIEFTGGDWKPFGQVEKVNDIGHISIDERMSAYFVI